MVDNIRYEAINKTVETGYEQYLVNNNGALSYCTYAGLTSSDLILAKTVTKYKNSELTAEIKEIIHPYYNVDNYKGVTIIKVIEDENYFFTVPSNVDLHNRKWLLNSIKEVRNLIDYIYQHYNAEDIRYYTIGK